MIHGDADDEVCILYCFHRQSVALSSQDDGQPFLFFEDGVGEGDTVVTQGHGGCLEA